MFLGVRGQFWHCSILLFLLLPAHAIAQANLTSTAQVPLPKAFGEPGSVTLSAALGAVSDQIPIDIPPGRRGMQPKLSLSYSSMGGAGEAGLGWSIGTGRVERWRADGTPEAVPAASERYSYSFSGAGGELHDLDGDEVYRARIESIYRPFRKVADGWEMVDGEGGTYSFGSSTSSRIDGELWLLDYVEDAHGNTIRYAYEEECALVSPCLSPGSRTPYLSEIRYTGHVNGDPGSNRVVFEYETRPDKKFSYLRGVLEAKNLLLKRISVFAGDQLVRRYQLQYSQFNNGPSRLEEVTLVGSDNSSTVVLRTLEYGERNPGWPNQIGATLPFNMLDNEGASTGLQMTDVDGDGYLDLVDNGEKVLLGNGQGGFAESATWSASLAAANVVFLNGEGYESGVRLMDVNGDARPDLFIARPDSMNEVYLNTGDGWQKNTAWSNSLEGLSALQVAYFDPGYVAGCIAPHCATYPAGQEPAGCIPAHCIPEIPGDEDEDTETIPANPAGCVIDGSNFVEVHCSASSAHDGFFDANADSCIQQDHCAPAIIIGNEAPNSIEEFALVGSTGESKGIEMADVNGDGLVDIIWALSFTGEQFLFEPPRFVRAIFLNGGDANPGWYQNNALATAFAQNDIFFVEENRFQGYSFLDVNGDGFSDIINGIEGEQRVLLGDGKGWHEDPGYTASMAANGIFAFATDLKGQGLMPMDFNDDSLLDYVRAKGDGYAAFRNTGSGWVPDPAMAQVLNNLGIMFVDADSKGTGTTVADINGDGLGDIITASGQDGSYNRIVLSGALRSGQLVRATSTLGEITEINWTTSTRFDNTTSTGIQGLPFAMTVADRLSRADGRGNVLITEVDYAGGLFEDRGLRGFGWVEQKQSIGLRRETRFYQDEARSTQPLQIIDFDSDNQVRKRITVVMETVSGGPGITQVRMASTDNERFDPGGFSHTTVTNSYDDRIQPLTVTRDAEVSKPGDERTTVVTWARNDAAGIWGLPVRNQVFNAGGDLMSESVTLYDGLPQGEVLKGLPSASREMVEPGVYLTRSVFYDDYGNPNRLRDRTGQEVTFTYDAATSTFRVRSENAYGHVTRSEYDPRFGILVRNENTSGNVTTTELDAFGRISLVVAPGDETSAYGSTSFLYSDLGDPQDQYIYMTATETADTAEVFESVTMFDAFGNIYETHKEGSGGNTIVNLVELQADGQSKAASMPFYIGDTPVMTQVERDDLGRPVRVEDPLGQVLSVAYRGLDVEFLDARGVETLVAYTPDGDPELIRLEVDGEEQITRYSYDALGRMTSVIDALGNETRISYDMLGRRTVLEDPNAGTYRYKYDGEGRLVEQIGPDGKSMHLRYSAIGDLLEKELPDGAVHRFYYGGAGATNAVGRLVNVEDGSGVLELAYDERGNVIERRRTVDGSTYVVGFRFDSLDRVVQIIYPDGFSVDYQYDEGGNLAAVTDGDGRPLAQDFEYNAESRITQFGFGNGVRTDLSYDDLGRMLTSSTATGAGKDIQALVYGFDAANNVVALEDLITGFSQQFEYDEANRLVQALGPYGEESYAYDAIGNLLRKGDLHFAHNDPLHPQRLSCGVELSDKKSKKNSNASSADPCVASLPHIDAGKVARTFALAYDERGNVVSKGSRQFEYDGENRLAAVRRDNGSLVERNRYDASGELIAKESPSETRIFIEGLYEEGKTHVSRHVYAGPLLVATLVKPRSQVVLIETSLQANAPFYQAASLSGLGMLLVLLLALDRYYGWRIGRSLAGIGAACRGYPGHMMLVMLFVLSTFPVGAMAGNGKHGESEQRYYYHANHLGSVNVVTDDEARITARRDYRPYGETFESSGTQAGPRELLNTFQGQKLDDDTGLYYFKARHYDAELGQFLSADTVVADTSDPSTLNRYAFAGGNPVNFTDPTGRSFLSVLGDIGSSIVSGVTAAGEWIVDNADVIVDVITVIVIAAVVIAAVVVLGPALLAGTLGLAGFAALGAAIGFAVGGGIALGLGYNLATSEFWAAAGLGAGIGALVGASFAVWGPAALGGGKVALGAAAKSALIGAITGGTEAIIAGAASGSEVEDIFVSFLGAAALGAAVGALIPGSVGRFGKYLTKFKYGKYAPAAFTALGVTFTGTKSVYAGVASAKDGRPRTLTDDENIPIKGQLREEGKQLAIESSGILSREAVEAFNNSYGPFNPFGRPYFGYPGLHTSPMTY